MPSVPLASYEVAAVDECWSPLIGVEIEATNLTTLKPDAVVKTGKNGVAIFSGLPAGPHFFRARVNRTSTRVQSTLDPEKGRTYTGVVHLQIIAIGGSGIVKHCIVDANGFGTHTTIQAAVTACLALGAAFETVIYIDPGDYAENVLCDFTNTFGSIHFVAEGCREESLHNPTYNRVVRITEPGAGSTGPVFDFQGSGYVQFVGLSVVGGTNGAVRLGDAATDEINFLALNSEIDGGTGYAFSNSIGSAGEVTAVGCILKSDTRLVAPNSIYQHYKDCYVSCKGIIKGSWAGFGLEDCVLVVSQALPAGEYYIDDSSTIISVDFRMTNCYCAQSGNLTGGWVKIGGSNGNQHVIIHGNQFEITTNQTGIATRGNWACLINDNLFLSSSKTNGSVGVDVQDSLLHSYGIIVQGNIFFKNQVGIQVAVGELVAGDVIGPNAFYDCGTDYTNVPPANDYQISAGDLDHTLLDGDYHTDTLLHVPIPGDLIFANGAPKWTALAISVPAANVRNVVGIDNGETIPSWKTALDGTNPADIAAAASPGTSLIFSHREHVHAHGSGYLPNAHHTAFTQADADLLYDPLGAAAAAVAAHVALPDPHTQYALDSDLATHAGLSDVHHAGFIGLTIAGPTNIDPNAGDRITFVDSATITWDSPAANQIRATAIGGGGYTDEQAQDAVGSILVDTATVNFTYDDATPQITANVLAGGIDHGALAGLGDDDHAQYLLLAGRAGGQTAIGGTAASENLLLRSTAHATRGVVGLVDNAYAAGYLRVGSAVAPTNTTAGDLTAGRLNIGNWAFGTQTALISRASTDNASVNVVQGYGSFTPTAGGAYNSVGFYQDVRYLATVNNTGMLVGGWFLTSLANTGKVSYVSALYGVGMQFRTGAGAAMSVGSVRALSFQLISQSGRVAAETVAIDSLYGVKIESGYSSFIAGDTCVDAYGISLGNMGDSHVTNAYGLYIAGVSAAATLNIGIKLDACTTAALWLNTDTAASGVIAWGTACDTNLYRYAANVLKTDDGFAAVGHLAAGGNISSVAAAYVLDIQETFAGALGATAYRGAFVDIVLNPSGATTGLHAALRADSEVLAGCNQTFEWLFGIIGTIKVRGTGAKTHVVGIKSQIYADENNAVATDIIYISAGGNVVPVTGDSVTGVWGLEICDIGAGFSSITGEAVGIEVIAMNAKGAASAIGLEIGTISGGTANYGIKLGGAAQGAIWVNTNTAANGAILWGTALDTNLYRSAAGVLKTDGKLNIGTPPDYTVANAAVDRAFDADATTLDEIANVLGTLIADLTTMGLLQ